MRKIAVPFSALVTALVFWLPTGSAQAQSPRTFVSAVGSDSNSCTFAAPCRHFQAAVNATSAGGEVDALDPAGYGPIVISQAVTIEGQGWSYIAPPAGGNGITINAVSGKVSIHGVSLNGAGITGGTNGIVFNSGDTLTVTDCVAQNFAGSIEHRQRHPRCADVRRGQLCHHEHSRLEQWLCGRLLHAAKRFGDREWHR